MDRLSENPNLTGLRNNGKKYIRLTNNKGVLLSWKYFE